MKTIVEFPDQNVLRGEAADWLIRLDADTPPSRQDLCDLGEWLHRSPAHRDELERLAAVWGRMNVLTELAVPLGRPGEARNRHARQAAPATWSSRSPQLLGASFAVAATLIAAIGFLLTQNTAVDSFLATNDLYATAVGQQKTATLADGSEVMLNTNSQIRVAYNDSYREVHLLQGEALFTVAKNAGRPFRVYAGSGRIEALGTAFSVYLRGRDVDVTVAEGRVALASIRPAQQTPAQSSTASLSDRRSAGAGGLRDLEAVKALGTLSAGQVATLRSASEEAATGVAATLEIENLIEPADLDRRLAWREGMLMFSGDALADVIAEVSRYTTVTIEIPDPAVRSMRIGGRFPVRETEAMLAALEANFDLRVTRLDRNRVVLSKADE
jgi:transmembrane sensor